MTPPLEFNINAEDQASNVIKEITKNIEVMSDRIRTTTTTMTQLNDETATTKSVVEDMIDPIAVANHHWKENFKTMLPLLFLGMQMSQMFGGLSKRIKETYLEGELFAIETMIMTSFMDSFLGLFVQDTLADFTDWLAGTPEEFQAFVGAVNLALGALGGLLVPIISLKLAFPGLGVILIGLLPVILPILAALATFIIIANALSEILKELGLPTVWEGIVGGLENLLTSPLETITSFLGALGQHLSNFILNTLPQFLTNAFMKIGQILGDIFRNINTAVQQWWENLINGIKDWIGNVVDTIKGIVQSIWNTIVEGFNWVMSMIPQPIKDFIDFIGGGGSKYGLGTVGTTAYNNINTSGVTTNYNNTSTNTYNMGSTYNNNTNPWGNVYGYSSYP